MNNDQITALAREFSKEHDDSTIAYQDAKDVIHFLLRRYCLVEKSKVKEARALALDCHLKDSHLTEDGARYLFDEVLFPELGKEVEG